MRARLVLQRCLIFAVSLWALTTIAFLLIHLIPGDPIRASLGLLAPPEIIEARRAELHLDRPLHEQYAIYLGNLAHGEMGESFLLRQPVAEIIAQRLPSTLQLAFGALVIVVIAGLPAGLGAAALARRGDHPIADAAFTTGASVFTATPEFVSAAALTALFAVALNWFPVAGQAAGVASAILPTLALALGPTAAFARIVRIEALRVLQQDYIRTARAKRLNAARLYFVHVLPECLTATLTVGGLILCGLIAGTVLVENVFSWPGLGSALVLAITNKDYPLTQGLILTLGVLVLVINLTVDLAVAAMDPRPRRGDW